MVRRTRTMSRNSQRSMRGGVEPPSSIFGPPSQPSSGLSVPPSQVAASDDSLSKTASDAYNSTKNAATSATSYLANTFTNLFPSTENKRSSFLTRAGAAEIGRRYSDFSVEEDEMIAAKYGDFKQ